MKMASGSLLLNRRRLLTTGAVALAALQLES